MCYRAPPQQQFPEQSAVKVTHTSTHFLQSQCNEFTLQLNNWTTNLYILDPYSTHSQVHAANRSKQIQWDNGTTFCPHFGCGPSAMAILTQLIVLLPPESVVTSLQEASAFRTAFHTCCSRNQWSAKLTVTNTIGHYSSAVGIVMHRVSQFDETLNKLHTTKERIFQTSSRLQNPTQHSKRQTHSSCWSDFFTSSGSQ